ncbi:MAG: hypothetical protein ACLQNE_30495, partial [Thermoguttaceae bacterium]
MGKHLCLLVTLEAFFCIAGSPHDAVAERLEHRWFYLPTNLLVDKNIEDAVVLLDRAAKAGYNGVVLSDSKFMRWDVVLERYFRNVLRVRQVCRDRDLACIACVCPIGYSNDLLSRDPNLAEGLPVVDAPFLAKGGQLVPADESARLRNGGFEQWKKNMPTGWNFVDQPGTITFIDTAVRREGRASLRMQDIGLHNPEHGHGRASQAIEVKPFRYYHVSAAVKTANFEAAGEVRIAVLASDGTALNYYQPHIDTTQDWNRIDVTFNSLEFSQVNLYLGVWGGKGGTIWWDDVRLEPGGLVNVVRRDGAPLRATSEDGRTRYIEGQDFQKALDPKLGTIPYPGGFTAWHEPPVVTLPPGSHIRDGQKVLLRYFHTALIYEDQVMCCMAEPKVYEILRWQLAQVHKHIQPDGYFLQHDEIRVQGWDESCRRSGKTPGEQLAENVRKCTALVRKEDPGKPIYVWSDMFDPQHNAPEAGRYYLVKGNGPWYGSWKGLDKDVVIVNWNSDPAKRTESLKHFASLGHQQIL